ncbi:MAG TPA: DAK2 domain-containing protein [Tepidanaerobacteraceae bacterium]|nr:DAK2 domain-containing protein [Tepidanaerobacteraceae bacterium]
MEINRIDTNLLKKAIIHAAFVLRQNKKIVDALNVFPVPDGDTGTNMSLTMDQAVKELTEISSTDLKKVADKAAWGSLMGARGNSGVILSQLFRGFAQGIPTGRDSISCMELALAYKSGVDSAYRAVMRPVEGTILTVARETAEKMIFEAKRSNNLEKILDNTLRYGEKVLEKTPEMLKELKEANVVDAGGKGLLFLMKGFLEVIKNPEMDISSVQKVTAERPAEEAVHSKTLQEIKYIYCTELFVTGETIDIDALKRELSNLGDSMIVVGNGELVKIHMHTNNPDMVLGCSLKWGELSNIKIDNMKIQHEETIGNLAESDDTNNNTLQAVEKKDKEIGVFSVSSGSGLNEIFVSLGADIIEGGQSMNPSTESILSVVEKTGYRDVIILPNNKNIILTAEQVKSLSTKNIYVLPTKSIPQGISALLAFNPDSSLEDNISNMTESINNVISGEVTYAVRDTKFNGNNIKEGDILGIKDGNLEIVGKGTEEVIIELIDSMTEGKKDGIITIYYGSDIQESMVEKTVEILTQKYTNFDVEYYYGGQNLYYYIVSVE